MRALLGRLVGQVAKTVETDGVDGSTYGTLLALELDKSRAGAACLATLLDTELSPLEFIFIKRIRVLKLVTLSAPAGNYASQLLHMKDSA